jgi:hypothetical protein
VRLKPDDIVHEIVDISTLKPHPRNPRNGDIDVIGDSIASHGVYRSIVVSSDDYILAGNHTYAAAMEKGVKRLWIGRVPLRGDAPQALAIMLVDNRANDLAAGRYDEGLLLEVLHDAPLEFTGYEPEDVQRLIGQERSVDPHCPSCTCFGS